MGRSKKVPSQESQALERHARTPEERENEMVDLAVDLAEKQLREGTASSQVITHYLKLGSTREKLEREKIIHENKVLEAKAKAYESSGNSEELYKAAIAAFSLYRGDKSESSD